jgi:4-hydroxy-3-methylbut-2-enyl diphosphate reductase IspH
MSVTVAKTAGFCFGVARAVDIVENVAKIKTINITP